MFILCFLHRLTTIRVFYSGAELVDFPVHKHDRLTKDRTDRKPSPAVDSRPLLN